MSAALAPTAQDRSPWSWFRKLARASAPEIYGVYEYNVFSVGSGTITAQLTDTTQPAPSVVNIPIRPGIAGATTVPAINTLCLVVFANGDRTKPRVISYDATAAQSLKLDAATVSVGPSPTDFAALATKVNAINALIETHVHTGVQTGGGSSGPSPTLSSLPSVSSATVKVSP
jgi:hypothetical protein